MSLSHGDLESDTPPYRFLVMHFMPNLAGLLHSLLTFLKNPRTQTASLSSWDDGWHIQVQRRKNHRILLKISDLEYLQPEGELIHEFQRAVLEFVLEEYPRVAMEADGSFVELSREIDAEFQQAYTALLAYKV